MLNDKQLNAAYDYEMTRLRLYRETLKELPWWRFIARRMLKALIADASFQCQSLEMYAR